MSYQPGLRFPKSSVTNYGCKLFNYQHCSIVKFSRICVSRNQNNNKKKHKQTALQSCMVGIKSLDMCLEAFFCCCYDIDLNR